MADVVVSNTNPSLAGSDTFPDGEPSIAINPTNPTHISLFAFSSCWLMACDSNDNAAIWTTLNGGGTWTKSFTVPPPPNGDGANAGCPCDQTPDYARSGTLFSTFLTEGSTGHVFSGSTTDPTSAAAWSWHLTGGNADQTNISSANADQPWLRVGMDPTTTSQDNSYVAYDDFATNPPTPRVAVSPGSSPPNFTTDHSIGVGPSCCVNPGLRLAVDSGDGSLYALWQQATFNNSASPKINIQYMLNRSTDGGQTWGLNGSSSGIQLASGPSDQIFDSFTAAQYKFGTVNALLGGIDHAAVDPATHDVYYVYGLRDTSTGNNRLLMVQLTPNGSGGFAVGTPTFVTGQVQAALPSVAVSSDGTIGVLYDTYDGTDGSGFPLFSAHLARSSDHGSTFSDTTLLTFSSDQTNNGNSRQRVLGDYQQLKTLGSSFYGTFTANGASFGRSTANMDPVFFMVAGAPNVTAAAASSVTNTGATLNSTINPNGTDTTYKYEYGTSTSFGTVIGPFDAGSGATPVAQPGQAITGLTPATTYYYRACARNGAPGQTCGAVQAFTTGGAPTAPSATTGSATSIGNTGATLAGVVNAHGANTSYTFEYGTGLTFGHITTPDTAGSTEADYPVSAPLSGLSPNTTYFYRLVATNSSGTTNGPVLSFTTTGPATAPSVTTGAASSVTSTGARLNGMVNPEGQSTTFAFEYGTTTSFGSLTAVDNAGSYGGNEAVSLPTGALTAGTQYFYRIVATNASGTSYGTVGSFSTP